jgi:hypothetical protein
MRRRRTHLALIDYIGELASDARGASVKRRKVGLRARLSENLKWKVAPVLRFAVSFRVERHHLGALWQSGFSPPLWILSSLPLRIAPLIGMFW